MGEKFPKPNEAAAKRHVSRVNEPPREPVSPAAQRALAEAAERRAKVEQNKVEQNKAEQKTSTELDGPNGPEPTRYGDWERKGIASDF